LGYEINQAYITLAENRLEAEKETRESTTNTDNPQPSDETS
jgi:hypothetical protein